MSLTLEARVTFADDGDTAVDAVKKCLRSEKPFDIIFMDFIMKRMNGPVATKIIRSLGYSGPLIAVTGNVLSVDIETFKAAGADAVLEKPVTGEVMISILRSVLPTP